jgi:hypothetical protein
MVALHALAQWTWGLERLAGEIGAAGSGSIPDHEVVMARLESGRAFAAFPTPAGLAGFLALTIPATAGLALASRGARRLVWSVVAAAQALALLATASATGTAALLCATLLAGLLAASGSRRAFLAGAALAATLLAGVALVRGARLVDRADSTSPLRLRAGNARAAWQMAGDHPWLGAGLGAFAELYPSYRQPGDNETRHAHDLPLELAAEAGFPLGLLAAGGFFLLFLAPLRRERQGPLWRRGAAVGLAAFALHNLADFTAYLPSVLWSAALLRGALARPAPTEGAQLAASRAFAAACLAAIVAACLVVAASALGRDSRMAAREAAWSADGERALRLAERGARAAPWDVDCALAAARANLGDASAIAPPGPRRERAAALAERAVRLSPVRPSARALRARLRWLDGDLPGAYADLLEAARLHPAHAAYARDRDAVRERLETAASAVR